MTFMVDFIVDGEPVAKARPRFVKRQNFVQSYTPQKTKTFEQTVAEAAKKAMGASEPLEGPLALSVRIYRVIPKSWSKQKIKDAERNEIRPISKPDIDNYIKAVMDACNGVLWVDDSQVVELHSHKAYSKYPHVEITMFEVLL